MRSMWRKGFVCISALLMAMEGTAEEIVYTDQEYKTQLRLMYLNFTPVWIYNEKFLFPSEQRKEVFKAADDCIDLYNQTPNLIGDRNYCPFTFDGWKCWNYTKNGTTAQQQCPSYVPLSNEDRIATKVCNVNGTWYTNEETGKVWTNYTDCMHNTTQCGYVCIVAIIYYVGYGLSVLSCCIALFIFCYFKSLACPRVTMHKNLFLSFVLHGITYIIFTAAFVTNTDVIARNGLECKMMLMVWQYFQMCSYFWMLCEGIYLHLVVVVAVMANQNTVWWYYVIGWVLPVLFIVVSAICKTFVTENIAGEDNLCWITNSSSLDWITAVPIIVVLIVNFLMLLNILRVLISKLQHTHNNANSSYRRAARATLILVPLLGLHYIIVPMRIESEVFYAYFMAVCLSFQGFFVACIFCFFNAEVKAQIIRRWFNYTVNRKSRRKYTRNSTLTHTSMTEYTNTTPQNTRHKDLGNCVLQENTNRPNGLGENSPHLGNGRLLTDSNCNTRVDKQNDVDTPLIEGSVLAPVEPDFKAGNVSRLDSGYCDAQIDTAV